MAIDDLFTNVTLDPLTPASPVGGQDRNPPKAALSEKVRRRPSGPSADAEESLALDISDATHKIDSLA
jgi:hypothetical protein